MSLIDPFTPPHPLLQSSYRDEDVTMLLKELDGGSDLEMSTEERERLMGAGQHYSEQLPIEFRPSQSYRDLFETLLARDARRIAHLVLVLAARVMRRYPGEVTLVSLARAGTPVGVLLRRALVHAGRESTHYGVSIVRDRGLDGNAMRYVLSRHESDTVLFVDGWTGKGVINRELARAVSLINTEYEVEIDPTLAVLADPAWATDLFATREDVLIPSAALNSTVSGLMSRSVLNHMIGLDDMHGAKVYREFADDDISRRFVDTISAYFDDVSPEEIDGQVREMEQAESPDWRGWTTTEEMKVEFGLSSVNLVKPGIGETTRVLLRRSPARVLYDPAREADLEHVLALAREREVPLEPRPGMPYACVGLIRGASAQSTQ